MLALSSFGYPNDGGNPAHPLFRSRRKERGEKHTKALFFLFVEQTGERIVNLQKRDIGWNAIWSNYDFSMGIAE
jgi:hypothetical protein